MTYLVQKVHAHVLVDGEVSALLLGRIGSERLEGPDVFGTGEWRNLWQR